MDNKNFLIALIVILVGLATFLGGYLIAQKENSPQSANISILDKFSSSNTKNQTRNEPKLLRLSAVKAIDPYISEDGKKILYLEKGSGKTFATDFSGQNSTLIETEKTSPLNPNISGVILSKDKRKIAYLYFEKNAGEGQISIANPDGSVFKNILPTRANKLKIDWVSDSRLSFYNPDGDDHSLFLLHIESKQLEKILDSRSGLKTSWSPDGSKLIYSHRPSAEVESEHVERLSLLDLKTKETLIIDIPAKADQCVWSLSSIFAYCGNDKLYQLDVNKKEFGLVFQPSPAEQMRIKKPLLSPAENFLFFVNELDGYLYRISLD